MTFFSNIFLSPCVRFANRNGNSNDKYYYCAIPTRSLGDKLGVKKGSEVSYTNDGADRQIACPCEVRNTFVT